MAFQTQPIVVGDTVDFTLNAQKDGAVWDITGGEVLLYLRKPDGNVSGPYEADITSGIDGEAHYLTDDTLIDTAGEWFRQWKVSKSGITLWSGELAFPVERNSE